MITSPVAPRRWIGKNAAKATRARRRKRSMRVEPLETRRLLDAQPIIETPLIEEGDSASYLIPTVANGGDALGDTWHDAAFDDTSWPTGPTSFGYGELAPPLAVAGELFVDLDAADLAGADPATDPWVNRGTLDDFAPRGAPTFGLINGAVALTFDGVDDWYEGPTAAPGLVGLDPTRSIEVWAYNASALEEETLVAWSNRGGPDGTNMSFNYGTHASWGAVGHWGGDGPDMGWIDNTLLNPGAPEQGQWHHLVYTYDGTTTRVYADGVLENSETLGAGTINTHAPYPIRIASQNADGAAATLGSLSVGRVRVHDGVLGDADVLNNFDLEKGDFGFIEPDLLATPAELNVYKRFGSPEAGVAELTVTNLSGATIDNVTFGSVAPPFDGPNGGPANAGSLANNASAVRSYEFNDGAPELGILLEVTGDGAAPATVVLNGVPVGPAAHFEAGADDITATLEMDFVASPVDGAVTRSLSIGNTSTDGDLGDLTDLTVSSVVFHADPEGRFQLIGSLPTGESVLSVGDGLDPIAIQFDSGGEIGTFGGATIVVETDQGVAKGTRGEVFTIQLTATVQEVGLLSDPPVHRYSFDGNANDSIGGAHGTAYGGVDFVSQTGKAVLPNTGQLSNASDPSPPNPAPGAYIDLPNGIISALGQGGANNNATFEVWTTWTEVDNPAWQRVFDFGTSNGGENYSPDAPDASYIFLTPRSSSNTLRFGYQKSPPRQELTINGAPLTKNVEKHLAVVWDGDNSEVRLYEDGALIDSGSLFMGVHGADMQLTDLNDVNNWLGRAQWPDELYSGSYNEFRIYDYALSEDQVTSNSELGPTIINVVPETGLAPDAPLVTIPARQGSGQSGSAAVSVSNAGQDPIDNVTFDTLAGMFSGPTDGAANTGSLAGGASVARSYAYLPDDDVADVTVLQITGDGVDPAAVTLNGLPVGPDVQLLSSAQDITTTLSLHFAETEDQGLVAKPVSIGNNTADDDFGALTNLTIVSATFFGGPDGKFSLDGTLPTPGTVLAVGESLPLPAVQLDTNGDPGAYAGATLQLVTDTGAASGAAGATFTIQISADVFEAGTLPDELIHRYSFSETGPAGTQLIDSIGGQHGTIVDLGASDGTVGGGQVTLAGGGRDTSDFIDLPDGLISGLSDATIELWATQHSVQNWSRIFDIGSSTDDYVMMSWTRGADINLDRVEIKSTDDGGVLSTLDDQMQPYTLGQQFHIVMTVDQGGGTGGATRIRVYKDGVLEGTFDTTNTLSAIDDVHVWLGRSLWPDNTANASYNELRIYDAALTESQIVYSRDQGPDVVSTLPPPAPPEPFPAPPYGTDLSGAMPAVNASAFVRVPFDIVGEPSFDFLTLHMQYDDGFVAFLNGVEVAHANAPGRDGDTGTLAWNSTATAEQSLQGSLQMFQYTLSPELLQTGTNVLAIHGLNLTAADADFVVLPELIGGTVPRDRVQPIPDSYALPPSSTLDVDAAAGVLTNDENPDLAPLTVELVDDVDHGTLALANDGSFSYTPTPGYLGGDEFTYQIPGLPGDPMIVAVSLSVDDPPVAGDDNFATSEDTPLVVAAPGVLDNDSDAQTDPLTAVLADPPAHGQVSLAADGSFTYAPDENYFGPDAFTYTANDGDQDSVPATVSIDVQPINDAPLAVPDTYFTIQNEPLAVPLAEGVLVNDIDVDSAALSAALVDDAQFGTLALQADGSFTYQPDLDFIGTDSFTYRAHDTLLPSEPATVTLIVNAPSQAVVINEIFYDPDDNDVHSEFIELLNTGNQTLNLGGWQFTDGIAYTFPLGTTLDPGQYVLIADEPAVVLAEFGQVALGPWSGRLSNNGERVELRDATGAVVDEVDYRAEFPWPIAANGDGASMELIDPALDNDLAGSWRASLFVGQQNGGEPEEQITYLDFDDTDWHYRKGVSEPAGAAGDWRLTGYDEGADTETWSVGQTPIGYGDGDDNTVLADMLGGYTSVYLRHEFTIPTGEMPEALLLTVYDDDGAIVWINGAEVGRFHVTEGEKAFNDTAQNHEAALDQIELTDNVAAYLVEGVNTIAVHALNQALTSSDFSIDARLQTPEPEIPDLGERVPTPGAENSVFAENAPPQTRQVQLNDDTPQSGQEVVLTAKVTDPNGVASVVASVQVNEPGNYIPAFLPLDPATLQNAPYTPQPPNPDFEDPTNWTEYAMVDDGTGADAVAGDGIYSAYLPGQINRTLVRYRIAVQDNLGAAVSLPYNDDPSLNFAYYVYDGLPDYVAENSFQSPGTVTYAADDLTDPSIAVYTLISRDEDVAAMMAENLAKPQAADAYSNPTDATWLDARKTYNYEGAFVYEGKVYDHIHYRIRGSNSRYTGIKRNMKFRFNRGNYLEARDINGEKYDNEWKTLVTSRMYGNKLVQNYGLTETVNSMLWQLFDVPARDTHYIHFRVVDGAEETPTGTNGQYAGDFWGMMLGFEAYDGIFLDNHNLADGNLYKLADFVFDGDRQQRHQAYDSVGDLSDYDLARWDIYTNGTIGANGTPAKNPTNDPQWLRDNVNLDSWYRYHTVVDAVRHYDMFPEPEGRHRLKNLVWYFEPPTPGNPLGKVQFWEYDSDASWGPNFNTGNDQIKNALYAYGHTELQLEYRNYIREFRDLIWTEEVIQGMIDRLVEPVEALANADRDRWEGNPLPPGSQTYNLSSIEAKADDMKAFAFTGWNGGTGPEIGAGGRAAELDAMANAGGDGTTIPNTPTITYVGLPGFALTNLTFQSSAFSDPQGSGTFAAMEWRLGEITDPTAPAYDPDAPWQYEYDAAWQSGPLATFNSTISVPPDAVQVGHTYRARVRMQDNTGRWSHWSAPVEFTVQVPDNAASADNLVITEINYNPADPTPAESAAIPGVDNDDFEFIELMNIAAEPISLANVAFAPGSPAEFNFDSGTVYSLDPGQRVLVVGNTAAFDLRYGGQLPVAGQFTSGKLSNGGEQITLLDAFGEPIRSFTYNDRLAWPVAADGYGFSLVLGDPASNPDHANPFNWRASGAPNGSPGVADVATVPPIVISEALTHTDPPAVDAIELFNPTASPVDVGGWFLSDNDTQLQKYTIPADTIIPAGQTLVIHEDDDADPLTTPPADYFGGAFSLSSLGEEVILSSGDGASLTGHTHGFDFTAAANGVAFIRHVDSTGWEHFTAQAGNPAATLGAPNNGFRVGEVVITELHYNPDGADPLDTFGDEFIEIQNVTAATVELFDAVHGNSWQIDGLTFAFPPGASLASGEVALVVGINPEVFRATYAVDAEVQIFGPYLGNLSNGGERIAVQRPDVPQADLSVAMIDVDVVRYDDVAPWPTAADGDGSSLHRTALTDFGSDPASWSTATPTPGQTNLLAPRVVGAHLFYNNSAFDGADPAANAADDDAVATDKTPLRPGDTATYLNYSSFGAGINGVMIDLVGVDAPAAITADDFAFHVGNDDDPANWPEAPPPASVTVRSGDGAGGSDRVTLIWDDAEITQAWLQVTVKAGGATDLVLDHLFLFGNAVGETGNDPANALVTAADLVAIRDNPRSAGNRADIASPQDLNRDQHVDALDAVLARNHATGPFNALRLITPSLPTPPPPEAEAEASGATAGLSNSAKQPATSLGATGCLPASAGQTAGLPQLAQRHNLPTPHRPTSLLEQTNSLPHRRTAKQPSDHPFAEIDSALADLLATDWR